MARKSQDLIMPVPTIFAPTHEGDYSFAQAYGIGVLRIVVLGAIAIGSALVWQLANRAATSFLERKV